MLMNMFASVLVLSFLTMCSVRGLAQQSGDSSGSAVVLPDAPQPQVQASPLGQYEHGPVSVPVSAAPSSQELALPLNGTHAKLSLVSAISSKMPSGSAFQARLEEPIAMNGKALLPKGTLFEGHLETRPARHIMRPGALFMMFDRVVLPEGTVHPVDLTLVSTDSRAVKTDPEGHLHPALSKKRLVIQLGGTALAAKFADDLAQVIGGTAVSEGTARYYGMGAAATFMLIQKGREVKLRPGDKLEVEFGRAGNPAPLTTFAR
jgi:hypothetical protein